MLKTKTESPDNFWSVLPKPFFVLAPMANVTDAAFRKIITKYGKPDIMWTEFVSADGLVSAGKKKLLVDLQFSENERPIVAQLFTGHPDAMREAAMLVKKLGFDGLDINMGCPDRAVEKQGGGAAMIKNPDMAIQIIKAAKEGVGSVQILKDKAQRRNLGISNDSSIPISVKTRLGYNKVDYDWIRALLGQKLPALTIHLRTRKEMSDVSARWEIMPEIVKLRDEISPETLVIGNGDTETLTDAALKVKKYGCDGVMIGRGIFGKPWLFENQTVKTPAERLKIMVEHAKLFEKIFKGVKNFAVMKKHFKAYVSGWDGAKELRMKLMETTNAKEVERIIKKYSESDCG